jgi:hypothetical protein
MKVDLDDLERKARAAEQDEWQWRRGESGVLEGKHAGQVVMFCNTDAGSTDEPALIAGIADKAHIAANSPPVTLALIARIRELEAAVYRLAPRGKPGSPWAHQLLEKGAVLP